MDNKEKKHIEKLVEQKLNKTTNKIKKSRKNIKDSQKEAAEFEEIHKLLEFSENELPMTIDPKPASCVTAFKSLEYSSIPPTLPGIKVFNAETCFCLFNEKSLCLKNFIDEEEKCTIFGKDDAVPSETSFRQFISHHLAETLLPQEGKSSSISLYVLYLMSTHEKPAFVSACYDFLKVYPFYLHPKDLFPIFINFGASQELFASILKFDSCGKFQKFLKNNETFETSKKHKFPVFHMDMVGRIILYYITNSFIKTCIEIKSLVTFLGKITLDPKIRSSSLLALYSTILTTLCFKIKEDFELNNITNCLYFKDEHLLNQLEICRIISKSIFPELYDNLVLKTIFNILRLRSSTIKTPIKIELVKYILQKLKVKKLPPLEIYSLLQLINGSLPCITTTIEDSVEINIILTYLEKKISQTEDTVDLIRLKLELAKMRNLVANNINNRFTMDESLKVSPLKRS